MKFKKFTEKAAALSMATAMISAFARSFVVAVLFVVSLDDAAATGTAERTAV